MSDHEARARVSVDADPQSVWQAEQFGASWQGMLEALKRTVESR